MPEIVTRYPEVLIQELKDVGGKCGQNIPPQILTSCPADRFCSLPTGEICIYDLSNLSTMTQVSHGEWYEVAVGRPGIFTSSNFIILVIIFGLGLLVGFRISKPKNAPRKK